MNLPREETNLSLKVVDERAVLTCNQGANGIAESDLGAVRTSVRESDQPLAINRSHIAAVVDGSVRLLNRKDFDVRNNRSFEIKVIQSPVELVTNGDNKIRYSTCLLYTSPSPRD